MEMKRGGGCGRSVLGFRGGGGEGGLLVSAVSTSRTIYKVGNGGNN